MANTTIPSELIQASVALGGSPTTTTQSASDNTTKIATTAYVTSAVNSLIDSAPGTMNTLNEIAAALNDDAAFNTTVTNAIATKLPLAGGTMTGNIAHGGNLTLDVVGNIHLDSGSGEIRFYDGGTYFGKIRETSGNLEILSGQIDKDLLFIGNDNGSAVTALTLDMSAAGAATFNNGIKAGADVAAFGANTGSSANRMAMSMEGSGVSRLICNGADVNTNGTFEVFTANSSGTGSAKLTVNASGNATFAGTINGFGLKAFGTSSLLISDDGGTGSLSSANYNTGFGHSVFNSFTSGDYNTAIGFGSMGSDTVSGEGNVGMGMYALRYLTSGSGNVAVGWDAAITLNQGSLNVAVGKLALKLSQSGSQNVAIGTQALQNFTESFNTAVGYRAMLACTSGERNTAIGYDTMIDLQTSENNTALGWNALKLVTGGDNTAIGSGAGDATTSGTRNVYVGIDAGGGGNGSENCFIGRRAGRLATSSASTALGTEALQSSTGAQNTAVGWQALMNNAAGAQNTAVGYRALDANLTGNYNVGIGTDALGALTSGSQNTTVGYAAGQGLTGASNFNVAIGDETMLSAGVKSYNTAVGSDAMRAITTGQQNVSLGYNAGSAITTGVGNICIGYEATTVTNNRNYSITMGRSVASVGDYYFTFGVDADAHRVYNNFTSNASWTRASDERIKKDISTNTDCGLNFINDLRTVTYKFKAPSELDSSMAGYDASKTEAIHKEKMYGFVAQEVKAAMNTHNITDFAGHHQLEDGADNLQGISYEMFVMPLVKALQEADAKIESLTARIETLEG